jgi:hypothetical protein
MSSATEFFSSRRSHRILPIDNDRHAPRRRTSASADLAERIPEITVAPGHGQSASREKYSRAPDQSILDCASDTRLAATYISDRGETAIEGVTQHFRGVARDIGQWLRFYVRHPKTGAENMTVSVDQARHQRLSGDVDNIPVTRRTGPSIHRHYAVALDNDDGLVEVLTLHPIENSRVQEGNPIHKLPPIRLM